jgi:hypothetical protein
MEKEYWYRYEDVQYAPSVDEFDSIIQGSGRLEVRLRKIPVLRHTQKGVWVEYHDRRYDKTERFLLRDARKRYACPTIEEAKESFIARKKRQMRIHQAAVDRAKAALQQVDSPGYGLFARFG